MKTNIEIRREITAATVEKFKGKPFVWGKYDCARLAAFHLKQAGLPVTLSKFGSYKTALGARRALEKAGHKNLGDAAESLGLTPIPPAAALIGDIVELEGNDATGTLAVSLGNGRVLGWHEDVEACCVMQPLRLLRGWRVV